MEDVDHRLDGFHQLAMTVVSPKFTEGLCLLPENGTDRLDRVACLELEGELMPNEACARLPFVFLPGSLKELIESRRFKGCTHITS